MPFRIVLDPGKEFLFNCFLSVFFFIPGIFSLTLLNLFPFRVLFFITIIDQDLT